MNGENIQRSKEEHISFIYSIAAKITLVIAVVVIVAIAGCMVSMLPRIKKTLSDSNQNYIMSMAVTASELINKTQLNEDTSPEVYAELLSDIQMTGISSSYAYLVSADGVMLYHPTADKIGSQVENEVVSGIVAELKKGKIPTDEVVSYVFNGAIKYAAHVMTNQGQILVVTADEHEILLPINNMTQKTMITCLIILVICLVAGYVTSKIISKPIKRITGIVNSTAELNFYVNEEGENLCRKRDETGAMARAVRDMRRNLRVMVNNIDEASSKIEKNVMQLQKVTNAVNNACTDNSATSQELAAGMEETVAATESIHDNITEVHQSAEEIGKLSIQGNNQSQEVMERAESLKEKTLSACEKTQSMYLSVKTKANQAIEDAKVVDKINELTDTIMAISSQTSLLALNASIEAARAGDAGRGFAVVASEIGNLAKQTSSAITNINEMVDGVHMVVSNMSECLGETTDFLENTVIVEYKEFERVSEQYRNDADVFKMSMTDVNQSIVKLIDTIKNIVDALDGINSTIEESSGGVSDIAEKTGEMVNQTSSTHELVEECNTYVNRLNDVVNQFKLEK